MFEPIYYGPPPAGGLGYRFATALEAGEQRLAVALGADAAACAALCLDQASQGCVAFYAFTTRANEIKCQTLKSTGGRLKTDLKGVSYALVQEPDSFDMVHEGATRDAPFGYRFANSFVAANRLASIVTDLFGCKRLCTLDPECQAMYWHTSRSGITKCLALRSGEGKVATDLVGGSYVRASDLPSGAAALEAFSQALPSNKRYGHIAHCPFLTAPAHLIVYMLLFLPLFPQSLPPRATCYRETNIVQANSFFLGRLHCNHHVVPNWQLISNGYWHVSRPPTARLRAVLLSLRYANALSTVDRISSATGLSVQGCARLCLQEAPQCVAFYSFFSRRGVTYCRTLSRVSPLVIGTDLQGSTYIRGGQGSSNDGIQGFTLLLQGALNGSVGFRPANAFVSMHAYKCHAVAVRTPPLPGGYGTSCWCAILQRSHLRGANNRGRTPICALASASSLGLL